MVNAFGLVLTIVALLGVALLILLFERQRATRIERDLGDMAKERRDPRRRGRPGE